MRPLVSLLLALVLATPLAHATPSPTATTAHPPQHVLLVGDSLSAAHRIPPEAGWVVLLQHRLDHATATPPAIVNASRGGKTLADALRELPSLLAAHHPQLVILELGANDAILGASQLQMRRRLARLIDLARAAGAQVAVLGFEIPPALDKHHSANKLHAAYASVRHDRHVVVLPSLMAGISDKPALLLDDGEHPTAAAQKRMLDNAWGTLRPLLLD